MGCGSSKSEFRIPRYYEGGFSSYYHSPKRIPPFNRPKNNRKKEHEIFMLDPYESMVRDKIMNICNETLKVTLSEIYLEEVEEQIVAAWLPRPSREWVSDLVKGDG